jgi:hypothetical protein
MGDVDRYPFLQALIKHVFLKNESRLSIREIKESMRFLGNQQKEM